MGGRVDTGLGESEEEDDEEDDDMGHSSGFMSWRLRQKAVTCSVLCGAERRRRHCVLKGFLGKNGPKAAESKRLKFLYHKKDTESKTSHYSNIFTCANMTTRAPPTARAAHPLTTCIARLINMPSVICQITFIKMGQLPSTANCKTLGSSNS